MLVLRRAAAIAAAPRGARALSAAAEKLERTALYNLHLELGGKMVPFAGYELPVQYPAGVLKEHLHCRAEGSASLFDVGHMGQLVWRGKDAAAFLETVCVADVAELKPHEAKLTLLTLPSGGILDDSVITHHGSYIYMVVNGATKHGDMAHFDAQLAAFRAARGGAADVSYEYLGSQNLVALQGLGAPGVLAQLVAPGADAERVRSMPFMSGGPMRVMGVDGCIVTRCGYTGEDGYEISMPADAAVRITSALLGAPGVAPSGLGARDSLRLEAGLCLYGHDMDHTITPGEASLAWTIGKRRKAAGGFLGADKVLAQIKDKSFAKRRVGLAVTGAPAREGSKLFSSTDKATAVEVGYLTSGTFAPCLKAPIAMGYVAGGHAIAAGTALGVEVRGKLQPVTIAKMPFVPHRYFKA